MRTAQPQIIIRIVALCGMAICPLAQGQFTPAVQEREDVPDSAYRDLGAQPQFNCVVGIYNAYRSVKASGVLIAPNWVLTAAHAIAGNDYLNTNLLPQDTNTTHIVVTYSNPVYSNDWRASEWFIFPGWDGFVGAGSGTDIGLIRVNSFAPTNVAPAVIHDGADVFGRDAVIAGYGAVKRGTTEFNLDGFRRAGQNVIDADGTVVPLHQMPGLTSDAWGNHYFVRETPFGSTIQFLSYPTGSSNELVVDLDSTNDPPASSTGSASPRPLEGNSFPGDSGGGFFIETNGGVRLVGINSFSWSPLWNPGGPHGNGSLSAATWVRPYLGWIRDHLNVGALNLGSYASSIESPGIWILYSDSAPARSGVVPGPEFSVVFNSPALTVTNFWSDTPFASCFDPGPAALFPESRTQVRLWLVRDRQNTRMRVRRGIDLTLDLAGFTYSLSSTSPHTASIVVGQDFSDSPILRVTNGVLEGFDATIGETRCTWPEAYFAGVMECDGTVYVSGDTSRWRLKDSLFVGGSRNRSGGKGTVIIRDGAKLEVAKSVKLWFSSLRRGYRDFCQVPVRNLEMAGFLELNGGSAHAGSLELAGGTLKGTGSMVVTGQLVWTGGTIAGTIAVDVAGGMDIGGALVRPVYAVTNSVIWPELGLPRQFVPLTLQGCYITNHGLARWRGELPINADGGAIIHNLSAGVFEAATDSELAGTDASFINHGVFRKAGTTNSTRVEWNFDNQGSVEAQSGLLRLAGRVLQASNQTLSAGSWIAGGGSTLELTHLGSLLTNRATIALEGVGSTFANLSGLAVNEGVLELNNGNTFATTSNLSNEGRMILGEGSRMVVNGQFLQGTNSILEFVLPSNGSTNGAGKLVCHDFLERNGELRVTVPEGSSLVPGQSFELMTYNSATGGFSSINSPQHPGLEYFLNQTGTNATLYVLAAGRPFITESSLTNGLLSLAWVGGAGPYEIQSSTNLMAGSWLPVAVQVTNNSHSLPVVRPAAFYRVVSQ